MSRNPTAIAAGCDAVLVCSGNHDLQAASIEALIRAVEEEQLPYSRVDEALGRLRRMKERFLVGDARPVPARSPRELATVLGREAHQAVAADMARFA